MKQNQQLDRDSARQAWTSRKAEFCFVDGLNICVESSWWVVSFGASLAQGQENTSSYGHCTCVPQRVTSSLSEVMFIKLIEQHTMEIDSFSVTTYPKHCCSRWNRLDVLVKCRSQGTSSVRTLEIMGIIYIQNRENTFHGVSRNSHMTRR